MGGLLGIKLVLTWEDIQLMITMGQLPLTGLEIEWHFLRAIETIEELKYIRNLGDHGQFMELSPMVHLFMVIHIVAPQLILMSKETLSVWELPEIQAQ